MQIGSFSFDPVRRWSCAQFPDLDSARSLLLVFGATEYMDRPQPLAELAAAYPRAQIIGCSTAGEISAAWVNDASLSVAVARFDHSRIRTVAVDISPASDSRQAGRQLAQSLIGDGLRAVFVLSDGLMANGSELVKGLNSALPPDVVVTGGLAGDGDRFSRTWVLAERAPRRGVITATGFYSDRLRVRCGSGGGYDSFGPERRVTRSEGKVLYELDGKPALALYREYLGELASGLPASGFLFPLSIRRDSHDRRPLVRTVLGIDDAAQSVTFAADIPRGCLGRLMKANFDRLVQGASDAASSARGRESDHAPLLAVAVSCVGRRIILGERVEEETEATLDTLPPRSQQVGFYSYGEISPHMGGASELHNQTMTMTTFTET